VIHNFKIYVRHKILIACLDLPSTNSLRSLYLTLCSILFAFVYDLRFTQHEPTPESAWTICIMVPEFSALDTSATTSIRHVVRASYRRALAFPLYRSWALCERCRFDVANILAGGRRAVLKCLLHVNHILTHHDIYYIYSKIWVEDFCIWIQNLAESVLTNPLSFGSLKLGLQ